MEYSRFVGASLIIGAFAFAQFTGCTAIGYGIGSGIDNHGGDYTKKSVCEVSSVKEGKTVLVMTDRDTAYWGSFGGVVRSDESEYAHRYSEFQQGLLPENTPWPDIGDSSVICLNSGDTIRGSFSGFDLLFGAEQSQPARRRIGYNSDVRCRQAYYGMIYAQGDSLPSRVLLQDIARIELENGDILSEERLGDLAQSGLLPLRSMIVVQQDSLENRIPVERVTRIQYLKRKHPRWVFLCIGAVVDAFIVAALIRDGFIGGGPDRPYF